MERRTEWSKVLLGAYASLPAPAKAAKKEALSLAMSGFSYRGDLAALMGEIIACNRRIEGYINAKVITDGALRAIGSEKASLLKRRYRDMASIEAIARELGVSVRTAFRRCADALTSFAKANARRGYGDDWFEQRYSKDALFCKVAEMLCRRENAMPKTGCEAEDKPAAGMKRRSDPVPYAVV